ncbi:hypothetical protein D3C72_1243250 [compost metagenome]
MAFCYVRDDYPISGLKKIGDGIADVGNNPSSEAHTERNVRHDPDLSCIGILNRYC